MKRNPAKLARQFVEFEELFSRKLTLVMSWQEAIFGQKQPLIISPKICYRVKNLIMLLLGAILNRRNFKCNYENSY